MAHFFWPGPSTARPDVVRARVGPAQRTGLCLGCIPGTARRGLTFRERPDGGPVTPSLLRAHSCAPFHPKEVTLTSQCRSPPPRCTPARFAESQEHRTARRTRGPSPHEATSGLLAHASLGDPSPTLLAARASARFEGDGGGRLHAHPPRLLPRLPHSIVEGGGAPSRLHAPPPQPRLLHGSTALARRR